MSRDVLLAVVTAAVGLKGEVRAKLFTATPDALPRYRTLHTATGRKLVITAPRAPPAGAAALAFEGVGDRNQAEALKGAELFVDRSELPQTDEDEFYNTDLIGLEARDGDGRVLGKVAALHNFGASDVIELLRSDGDSVHLVFSRKTVPVLNIEAGYIVVAVPEDDEDNDHVE